MQRSRHRLIGWRQARNRFDGGGQRVTRHYYDLHRLMASEVGPAAAANLELGADCVAHAKMFFNSPDLDLASAAPGSFALAPTPEMLEPLARDYRAMSGMIFGDPPAFDDVMASVIALEARLNAAAKIGLGAT